MNELGTPSVNDYTDMMNPEDIRKNKMVCIISYFWVLFFLPLLLCGDSEFGRFHANQSLILFILSTAGTIATRILKHILAPWLVGILGGAWGLFVGLLWVIAFLGVLRGRAREIPVFGKYRLLK